MNLFVIYTFLGFLFIYLLIDRFIYLFIYFVKKSSPFVVLLYKGVLGFARIPSCGIFFKKLVNVQNLIQVRHAII